MIVMWRAGCCASADTRNNERPKQSSQPAEEPVRWMVQEVARALAVPAPAALDPLARVAGVSIDSRALRGGELFVAIHGPNHDGHNFVAAALESGAIAAIVARDHLATYPEHIRG